MPAKIYYDRDREYYLNIERDYYNSNREYLLKKAMDKYNISEEDRNKRKEYSKNRYHNMSPEKKLELKIYQKEYQKESQKNYREKKKREHANFNKNAGLTP